MSSVALAPTTDSQTGSGQVWSNLAGALTSNTGTPATVTINGSQTSNVLDFGGWPSNQVPAGANINGISIGVVVWCGANNDNFQLVSVSYSINSKSGSDLGGSVLGTTAGGGFSTGGPTSFPPGLASVTASDINTGLIDLSFSISGSGTFGNTISANIPSITVYYTPASNTPMPRPVMVPARPCWWLRD